MNYVIKGLMPMRHSSERVPGKNYRDFAGAPLYHRVLETLLAVDAIDEVVIDTDSPVILEDCAANFPSVRLIERPAHLRDGHTPMNDVLLHDISQVDADFYLQTHSTNPLLTPRTVAKAIETFLNEYPRKDSLFSGTRMQTRLWRADMTPMNHDPAVLLRTQELVPVYEENSCIYIFSRAVLEARKNRIGERPILFPMEPEESADIDEELDFRVAEFLYLNKNNK